MKSLTVIIPTQGNESLGSVPSLSGCRHYLMTRINCFIYTHIHIHMCTHTLSASGLFCGTALWSISQYEPCTGQEDEMSQHTITGTPIVETLPSHTMDTRTHTHTHTLPLHVCVIHSAVYGNEVCCIWQSRVHCAQPLFLPSFRYLSCFPFRPRHLAKALVERQIVPNGIL